ncbi:unnamed protein product, partial [Pocillopora meandrina]
MSGNNISDLCMELISKPLFVLTNFYCNMCRQASRLASGADTDMLRAGAAKLFLVSGLCFNWFKIRQSQSISVFSYVKINLGLRHQQLQLRRHARQAQAPHELMPLNIARYKRTR